MNLLFVLFPVILLQLYFYNKALWADIQLIAVHYRNRVVEVVKYFCAGGLLKEHPLVESGVRRQDDHRSGGVASSYGHLMVMLWLGREACAMEKGKLKMENGKLGRRNKNREAGCER